MAALRAELDSPCMIRPLFTRAFSRSNSSVNTPFDNRLQFAQRDVQCFLGPIGAGAGVAEHAGSIALGMVAGVDGVAKPRFSRTSVNNRELIPPLSTPTAPEAWK